MIPIITTTFLELGDATSRNLEFSHRDDVSVSYGEETITESNLLGNQAAPSGTCPYLHLCKSSGGANWRRLGMAYYRPKADRKNAGPSEACSE